MTSVQNTIVNGDCQRIPRGDSGYTFLMPIGMRPPDPQPQPKRPHADAAEEEETI